MMVSKSILAVFSSFSNYLIDFFNLENSISIGLKSGE